METVTVGPSDIPETLGRYSSTFAVPPLECIGAGKYLYYPVSLKGRLSSRSI
jgi:hypothetical protein